MPRFFAAEELPDYEDWLDELEAHITAGELSDLEQYYVAVQDNNVIGCGGYAVDRHKQEAILAWGLVTNAMHRQGVGKALFMHRFAAIQKVCPECRIVLDTTQHSYPFFEKLGFVVINITEGFYSEGLDRYDMEWQGIK